MVSIRTADGLIFTGRTPAQVVRRMADAAWYIHVVKQDYKREVLARLAQVVPGLVPPERTTAREFLQLLVQHGEVTILASEN